MLSAAKEGEIGLALLSGNAEEAQVLARDWMAVFPDRFYIEVQRTNRPNDEEHLHAAVALADRIGAPLVATNDVRFIKQDDFEAHETRVCIGEGRARRALRRSAQGVTRGQVQGCRAGRRAHHRRSEEHTSELQSLIRISYAVFCLKKKNRS